MLAVRISLADDQNTDALFKLSRGFRITFQHWKEDFFFRLMHELARKMRLSQASTTAQSIGPTSTTDEKKGDDEMTVNSADPRRAAQTDSNLPREQHVPAVLDVKEKRIECNEKDVNQIAKINRVYPGGLELTLIMIALCLSVFCVALDNTIISTAIPKITDQFHSLNDVGWYGSSYLLCESAFQLFYGKLYTFFNIKWVYLIAIMIFEVGSLICATAPNSIALILGRSIAGLGCAGIFSGATLIIANTVTLAKRPIYAGAMGGMYGIASVAGPLMGGAFTTHLSWRWCFYINLPIGAVTVVTIFIFYNPTERAQTIAKGWKAKLSQLDILGTAVFLPMIVSLLLVLHWGGSTYAWGSWRIIICLVFFGVLAIAFGIIQWWKQDLGTVPVRVLKQRSVAAAAWFGGFLVGSFFVVMYYLPLWFQAIEGVDPMESGIHNISLILSLVITSISSGIGITLVGYYSPFLIASSVLASIGAGVFCLLKVNSGSSAWIGYQILYGVGVGFGMQQTTLVVQTTLPDKDVPTGTAIVLFSQTLGGALLISVASNVFTNRLVSNLYQIVPNLNPLEIVSVGATNIRNVVPQASLAEVLKAYNSAIIQTFYVSVASAALSMAGALSVEWKSVKEKKAEKAEKAEKAAA